jgi:hypothetical protein
MTPLDRARRAWATAVLIVAERLEITTVDAYKTLQKKAAEAGRKSPFPSFNAYKVYVTRHRNSLKLENDDSDEIAAIFDDADAIDTGGIREPEVSTSALVPPDGESSERATTAIESIEFVQRTLREIRREPAVLDKLLESHARMVKAGDGALRRFLRHYDAMLSEI